jgi:hypothetical protein
VSESDNRPGFAPDEDLDPIVFVDSGDSPELRASAASIPRDFASEEARGPQISRREKLETSYVEEKTPSEWVPGEQGQKPEASPNKYLEIIGKVLLAMLPIGIITGFMVYASTQI